MKLTPGFKLASSKATSVVLLSRVKKAAALKRVLKAHPNIDPPKNTVIWPTPI